jgi:Bacteriophage HK97-gp10, putative tail-component
MPLLYERSFTFDQGSLGRNLDTIDEKIHRFIKEDLEVAAARGQIQLKADAPWTDRSGDARRELWAEADSDHVGNYRLDMGHGVEYGIYLEKSNGARFQVIMPTLVTIARAFMESLEQMFAQLDNPAPIFPIVAPGVGAHQGTSQGAIEHGQHVRGAVEKTFRKIKKTRFFFRDAKGRFVSTKATLSTPKTPKTRRR